MDTATENAPTGSSSTGGDDAACSGPDVLTSPGQVRRAWSLGSLAMVIGGLLLTGMLVVGAVHVMQPKMSFGTVDLAGIVELERARTMSVVLRTDSTEQERQAALSRVKGFGDALETAIRNATRACECVLLARNAVVGSGARDWTDQIKGELGLAGLDAAVLRERSEQALDSRLPDVDALRRASTSQRSER